MYKVLITDDEKYVRLYLRNSIDWSKYGFEVVGEAVNGLDALEKIEELKPDVLLTDMDMPGMDGIKLIEEGLTLYPNMQCIVLSGYKDYKYIRTAVQNNVFDYLLKPVKQEELVEVITKLYDHMQQEDTQKQRQEKELKELKKNRFLTDLIGSNIMEDDVPGMAVKYGIGKPGDQYLVFYAVLDNDPQTEEIEKYYGEPVLRFLIKNITSEVFGEGHYTVSLINVEKSIVGIVSGAPEMMGEDGGKLIGVCKHVIDMAAQFLHISISISMGHRVDGPEYIRDSYLAALNMLNLRVLYGNGAVLTYHNTPIVVNRNLLTRTMESDLSHRLAAADRQGFDTIIDELLEHIRQEKTPDVFAIKLVYNHIVSIILRTLYEAGIVPSSINMYEDAMYLSFQTFRSFEEMIDTLKKFGGGAIEVIGGVEGETSSYITKTKKYIDEHIADDFCISDIANEIYITPNYLCTVFKAETGGTLSDYIARVRIDKAIELLQGPRYKINDIYKMVGYSSAKYFRRVFKKITGYSPSEYKKKR